MTKKAIDHEIKMDKNRKVKMVDFNGNAIRPVTYEEKSFLGKLIGGFFYRYVPLYKASYKHSNCVPFGEVVKGNMDMKTYKMMSEEDSLAELLKVEKPALEEWAFRLIFLALGAFVTYFLLEGGLGGVI